VGDAAPGHLAEVLRHEGRGRERERALFLVGADPRRIQQVREQRPVGGRERLQVEVRRPAGEHGRPVGRDADELQPLGEDLVVAGADLVGQQEEQVRLVAAVGRVYQERPLAQQVAVLLEQQVAHGEHERVAGMQHGGERRARPVERSHRVLGEADALVTFQDRGQLAAVAPGDDAVAVADSDRDVGDLEAGPLARVHDPAERREGPREEGAHEVGLEAAGLGLLHFLLHREEAFGAHRLLRQGVTIEDGAQVLAVERVLDAAAEPRADLRLVAVADRVEEQRLEAGPLEDLAEDVEDATLERVALDPQLLQQPEVDVALARLPRHEVPEVADLVLADAVDPPEALLEAVGVPGQVVVDHQVGVLQVHALPGRVGGDQHAHPRVGAEERLDAAALVAVRGSLDRDDGVGVAEYPGDLRPQVVQRVAVLGEDDQLPLAPARVPHRRVVLQDAGQLVPLAVQAGRDEGARLPLEAVEDGDLLRQFRARPGGGGAVDQRLLEGLLLLRGEFVVVIRDGGERLGEEGAAALAQLLLAEAALEAFLAALERLEDRLRAGREAALQRGQREAHRALAPPGELVGLAHLGLHVLGHGLVERGLGVGEGVVDGVRLPLGEERRAVEAHHLLLTMRRMRSETSTRCTPSRNLP